VAGVTARLNNTGYHAGPVFNFGNKSNIIPSKLRGAIKQFQTDHGITPTTVFDQKTKDKLYELGI
ncbi:MAG: peptidoglycan-binding domain-containing protein, partial [Planctomycetota bacterium]